jgi:hypothetical protein
VGPAPGGLPRGDTARWGQAVLQPTAGAHVAVRPAWPTTWEARSGAEASVVGETRPATAAAAAVKGKPPVPCRGRVRQRFFQPARSVRRPARTATAAHPRDGVSTIRECFGADYRVIWTLIPSRPFAISCLLERLRLVSPCSVTPSACGGSDK